MDKPDLILIETICFHYKIEISFIKDLEKIGLIKVVTFENNKFIGILTHKSIFDAFHEVFGHENGIRLALYTSDGNKKIERLSKAVRKLMLMSKRQLMKVVYRFWNTPMKKATLKPMTSFTTRY